MSTGLTTMPGEVDGVLRLSGLQNELGEKSYMLMRSKVPVLSLEGAAIGKTVVQVRLLCILPSLIPNAPSHAPLLLLDLDSPEKGLKRSRGDDDDDDELDELGRVSISIGCPRWNRIVGLNVIL